MSSRLIPLLFGFVRSALMSSSVSGFAPFRNVGLVDGFVSLWTHAWLSSWFSALPTVPGVASLGGRRVGMPVTSPAARVR